ACRAIPPLPCASAWFLPRRVERAAISRSRRRDVLPRSRMRGSRFDVKTGVESNADGKPRRSSGEHAMQELHADRSLADRRGDALDRAGADVARAEHARQAGLEEERPPTGRPALAVELRLDEIGTGADESLLVERDAAVQPGAVRLGAGHEEDVRDRALGLAAGSP